MHHARPVHALLGRGRCDRIADHHRHLLEDWLLMAPTRLRIHAALGLGVLRDLAPRRRPVFAGSQNRRAALTLRVRAFIGIMLWPAEHFSARPHHGRSNLKESRKRRTVGLYWTLRAPIAWMPIAKFLTASIRRTKLMFPVSITNSRAGTSFRVSGMSSSIWYPALAIMSRNREYSSSTTAISLNSVQLTSKISCW